VHVPRGDALPGATRLGGRPARRRTVSHLLHEQGREKRAPRRARLTGEERARGGSSPGHVLADRERTAAGSRHVDFENRARKGRSAREPACDRFFPWALLERSERPGVRAPGGGREPGRRARSRRDRGVCPVMELLTRPLRATSTCHPLDGTTTLDAGSNPPRAPSSRRRTLRPQWLSRPPTAGPELSRHGPALTSTPDSSDRTGGFRSGERGGGRRGSRSRSPSRTPAHRAPLPPPGGSESGESDVARPPRRESAQVDVRRGDRAWHRHRGFSRIPIVFANSTPPPCSPAHGRRRPIVAIQGRRGSSYRDRLEVARAGSRTPSYPSSMYVSEQPGVLLRACRAPSSSGGGGHRPASVARRVPAVQGFAFRPGNRSPWGASSRRSPRGSSGGRGRQARPRRTAG